LATARLVKSAPPASRISRQLLTDLAGFGLTGLTVALIDNLVFGLPAESGARIYASFQMLGFFAALDLASARERSIIRHAAKTGEDLPPGQQPTALALRFALTATTLILAVFGTMFLVVSTDIHFFVKSPPTEEATHLRNLLGELGTAFLVYLLEIVNLIISYARTMHLHFTLQNGVLRKVTQGELNTRVPVATPDEFGEMATHTNTMIGALRASTEELARNRDATIYSLASLAETRDNETGGHILRTQGYVGALALRLAADPRFASQLDEATVDLLTKSAPLHDVGKVGVPDAILLKPGKLTPEEFEVMKRHTALGRDALQKGIDILGTSSFLRLAQEIAYTHHEKWDGSGYPEGLSGKDIPLSGRLMALADVYDALISARIYKPAFPHEKAREIIMEGRGRHFDPDLVDVFLACEEEFQAIAARYRDE